MPRIPYIDAPIRTPVQVGAKELTYPWVQWFKQKYFGGTPEYLEGTHSERLAVDPETVAEGSIFYETDRGVWYVSRGFYWDYFNGIHNCAQVDLPAGLGAHDSGFLADVWDYGHLLQWSGASWNWGPGDSGSDYIVGFVNAPAIFGWHLCDGSLVNRLNGVGTITPVLLPDYTTPAYLKLGITTLPGHPLVILRR